MGRLVEDGSMSERSEVAGAPLALEAQRRRRGGGRLLGRLRRKMEAPRFELHLDVEPHEPRLGEPIRVSLVKPAVGPPLGLQVGLVGQETYWARYEDADGNEGEALTTGELHADWREVPDEAGEALELFTVPDYLPYSYTGEKVAFWWQVSSRSRWKLDEGVDTLAAGVLQQEANLRPGPVVHIWVRP